MLTYYFANLWLKAITGKIQLRGAAQSGVTTTGYIYLALSSTTPNQNGGNFTEPTDTAYHRVSISYPDEFFITPQDSDAGSISNKEDIVIGRASQDWTYPITYAGLYDAETGGNLLWYGQLLNQARTAPAPLTVTSGSIVVLPGQSIENDQIVPGALQIIIQEYSANS